MAQAHHYVGQLDGNIVSHDESYGKMKRLVINPNALNVVWGGTSTNDRYWKRTNVVPQEKIDYLELVGVYWLEVGGVVRFNNHNKKLPIITPNTTTYKLFFDVKLDEDASGWANNEVNFTVRLTGKKSRHKSMMFSSICDGHWHKVPEDGLEFTITQDNFNSLVLGKDLAISFAMYQIQSDDFKKGLVIRSVIIEDQGNASGSSKTYVCVL